MLAVKANKEYTVTNETKDAFLKEGYDIYNEKGEVIEYSPKKTVAYSEYIKIKKELEIEKTKVANSNTEELTKQVEELTKTNTELIKSKEELTKQVEKLTKQVEKASKE